VTALRCLCFAHKQRKHLLATTQRLHFSRHCVVMHLLHKYKNKLPNLPGGLTELARERISALPPLSLWGNTKFYLRVRSIPGVNPKPPVSPILDSMDRSVFAIAMRYLFHAQTANTSLATTQRFHFSRHRFVMHLTHKGLWVGLAGRVNPNPLTIASSSGLIRPRQHEVCPQELGCM